MRRAASFSTYVVLALLASPSAYAGTINVPADVPTIQGAIDSAAPGDVVLVAPGTYFENIDFKGMDIEVRSADGPEVTTIDGGGLDSVAKFLNGETQAAILEGFTLRNGLGYVGYCNCTSLGGGIVISERWQVPASPTIRGNRIIDNRAKDGGGIYLSLPCEAIIVNNIIVGNHADRYGGGICVVNSDSPGRRPILLNNTIVENDCTTALNGGGIFVESTSALGVWNCIICGNVPEQVAGVGTYSHCDIEGGVAGPGNFDADPLFRDRPGGDFHLLLNSPCVDAGDASVAGIPTYDYDGAARIAGVAIDVGADEVGTPAVFAVLPARGRYDSLPTVTVSGSNFSGLGTIGVRFGVVSATNVTVVDDSTLTCDLPLAEPGPVDVGVSNAYGEGVLSNGFTFTPALLISGDPVLGGTITLDYLMEPFGAIYAIAGFPPAVAFKTKPYDGTLCIDPFQLFFWVPLWPFDAFTLDIDIPNDPALAGTSYLAQALIGPKLGGKNKDGAWTNCAELTIQ